jgi:hypothetical protein
MSAPTNNTLFLVAGGHGRANNNGTADDPNVASVTITNGNVILTADTGKTVGSSFGTLSSRLTVSASGVQVGANGSVISTILTGTATLTYTAVAAQTCQEQTIAVTNASTTNFGVAVSPRASLGSTNLSWSAWVSASGTVSVRVCNPTTGSITPSAVAWGVTVVQ